MQILWKLLWQIIIEIPALIFFRHVILKPQKESATWPERGLASRDFRGIMGLEPRYAAKVP